jgi:ABC-type multidrug transport system fused ATPase/permease subunit
MGKWLKVAFLAALLIGAGYFFGMVCKQIDQAYELILSPSIQLLNLLLWFLLALAAVMTSAGLVAALLRPVWVGIIAFALSGLAMLLGWQVTVGSGVLVLVYLIATAVYAVGVAKELNQRIRFSVRPISEGQHVLLTTLVLVACGSLGLGYATHIEQEGFSIPESYTEKFGELIEEQIMARTPAEQHEEAVAEFREEFQHAVDKFSENIKPYEQFIPLLMAGSVFTPLLTIVNLLAWAPIVILKVVFFLLKALRVTKVVVETQEVQRLIID